MPPDRGSHDGSAVGLPLSCSSMRGSRALGDIRSSRRRVRQPVGHSDGDGRPGLCQPGADQRSPSLAAVTAAAMLYTDVAVVLHRRDVRPRRSLPKTRQGAEDFVRFVMAQVSKAYATGDPSLIRPLVDVTTCPDCSRWISATAAMKQNSQHYEGEFVTMQSVHSLTVQGDAAGVITQVVAPAGKTVDSQGRTVHARSAEARSGRTSSSSSGEHWFVTNTEIVR